MLFKDFLKTVLHSLLFSSYSVEIEKVSSRFSTNPQCNTGIKTVYSEKSQNWHTTLLYTSHLLARVTSHKMKFLQTFCKKSVRHWKQSHATKASPNKQSQKLLKVASVAFSKTYVCLSSHMPKTTKSLSSSSSVALPSCVSHR